MRKLLAAVAAISIGVGAATLPITPAMAAWSQCESGDFCLWTGTNAGGNFWAWTDGALRSQGGVTLPSGINNVSDSWRNRTPGNVIIFDNGDCAYSGWYRTMISGQQATSGGSDWGSKVSSIARQGYINYPC